MEQFYFNVERKITSWVRESHSITAESKEDAIKQMVTEFKKDELGDTETYVGQEHLFDCETYIDIEDNDGNATAELYFDGTYGGKKGEYHIFIKSYIYGNNNNNPSIFSYEEAELECLKKLIEIVKNK